ncbi:MAG TPA: SlyX family protein [Steroidobacteraceae bacterium]
MNDTTTERIEMKVAFLERANQELSDVVYRQEQEIQRLILQVAALGNRVEAMRSEPHQYTAEEERPPHY